MCEVVNCKMNADIGKQKELVFPLSLGNLWVGLLVENHADTEKDDSTVPLRIRTLTNAQTSASGHGHR